MLDVVYRAAWDDPRITNMAVTLRPGVDADAFTDELARRFGRVDGSRLDFRSNRSLRAEVFQVFDRVLDHDGPPGAGRRRRVHRRAGRARPSNRARARTPRSGRPA
ncbi:MAG: hypothetical protein IPG72_14895 [Ardenticatenales bacterium]|nr:hypothetical protein [Ardenticatenales bacterium]